MEWFFSEADLFSSTFCSVAAFLLWNGTRNMDNEERDCERLIHVVINLGFQGVTNSHSVKWSEMDPCSQTMGQIETGGGS
jgi:hypothetical protein